MNQSLPPLVQTLSFSMTTQLSPTSSQNSQARPFSAKSARIPCVLSGECHPLEEANDDTMTSSPASLPLDNASSNSRQAVAPDDEVPNPPPLPPPEAASKCRCSSPTPARSLRSRLCRPFRRWKVLVPVDLGDDHTLSGVTR